MNTWRDCYEEGDSGAQWWNQKQWIQTYTGVCLSTRKHCFVFFYCEDGQAQRLSRRLWRFWKFIWTQSCVTEDVRPDEFGGHFQSHSSFDSVINFTNVIWGGKKILLNEKIFFCSTLIYRAHIIYNHTFGIWNTRRFIFDLKEFIATRPFVCIFIIYTYIYIYISTITFQWYLEEVLFHNKKNMQINLF